MPQAERLFLVHVAHGQLARGLDGIGVLVLADTAQVLDQLGVGAELLFD